MNPHDLIPEQQDGISTDTENEIAFPSEEHAKNFFLVVKHRLLNVNGWHELAGKASAGFRLTDTVGKEVDRDVQRGDHFKISVPGPGNATGDGYDWVHVEAVEEEDNALAIRVRPCPNPETGKDDVAHFFKEAATSSFVVRREANKVIAAVHGRNEKPNTETETIAGNLRNAAVAAGAITGFSKLQWRSLVNGLLQNE